MDLSDDIYDDPQHEVPEQGSQGEASSDREPPDAVPGIDYLKVGGSVKMGSQQGNVLLLTRTVVFGLRVENNALSESGFGKKISDLLMDLFGYGFTPKRNEGKWVGDPMKTPQILALGPAVTRTIKNATVIAMLPIDRGLKVEQSRIGFTFSRANEPPLCFRGTSHKNAMIDFLFAQGIEVR